MIDEGNLLRFVQVRGTVVCHMLAPMSWPMSSWNHRMKGRAMSHPLRTWVARPALCCCQMPYFMDDPDRFFGGWPKALAWADGDALRNLGIPTSRCDANSGPQKKITCSEEPLASFCQKAEKDLRRYVEDMDFEVQSCSTVNGNHITSLMEGSSPSTPCEERSWT